MPLCVHGRTSREEARAEVLAAFAAVDDRGAPLSHREGVLWHEALFSPTTRYRDLALGPSPTGQRTIHHAARGSRVLLFVREQRKQGSVTEPFVCLGFARYESHEGERIWFVHKWRSAGDWSGRARWGGCR